MSCERPAPARAARAHRLLFLLAACGLPCLGCTTSPPAPDGGVVDDEDSGVDARRDAGPDAFMFLDGGPDGGDDPAVWINADCEAVLVRGATGQPCTGTWGCASEDGVVAACATTGRLVVHRIVVPTCDEAAPAPWTECGAALAGAEGQRCGGTWACAEVDPADGCCVEVALCNPVFYLGYLPEDRLYRARICDTACGVEPADERPTWTECPPVWAPGAPDPANGDPCVGSWACMLGWSHFGEPLSPLTDTLPVWCDGRTLRVGSGAAGQWFSGPGCE